jgi:hypothetical protein
MNYSHYILKDSVLLLSIPFKFEEFKLMSFNMSLLNNKITSCNDINFVGDIEYNTILKEIKYKYKSLAEDGLLVEKKKK